MKYYIMLVFILLIISSSYSQFDTHIDDFLEDKETNEINLYWLNRKDEYVLKSSKKINRESKILKSVAYNNMTSYSMIKYNEYWKVKEILDFTIDNKKDTILKYAGQYEYDSNNRLVNIEQVIFIHSEIEKGTVVPININFSYTNKGKNIIQTIKYHRKFKPCNCDSKREESIYDDKGILIKKLNYFLDPITSDYKLEAERFYEYGLMSKKLKKEEIRYPSDYGTIGYMKYKYRGGKIIKTKRKVNKKLISTTKYKYLNGKLHKRQHVVKTTTPKDEMIIKYEYLK